MTDVSSATAKEHRADPALGWRVGWAACADCAYRWVALLEPGADGDGLECPRCRGREGWVARFVPVRSAVQLVGRHRWMTEH